ncbi:MAG: hypothetical protein ACHQHO_13885 [Solirubrobacterales bacterium]
MRADEPQPLPDCEGTLALVRRPGELHEPLTLARDCAERLTAQAATVGVEESVAATLLVEAELLRDELARLGLAHLTPRLDTTARTPERALSAAEGDYLRSLTMRRPRGVNAAARVALPVRLHRRVEQRLLRAALAADLGQALAWEMCALMQGLTIGEWGLRCALELAKKDRYPVAAGRPA